MTEPLERASALPGDLRDEVARLILSFARDVGQTVPSTPEERAAVERSLEAPARGEFATDEDVRAVWAKYAFRGSDKRVLRSPTANRPSTTSPCDRRRAPAASLASCTPQKD